MKIDKAIKQLDGGKDKPTFEVKIDGDCYTIDKRKFVLWMLKEEVIKTVKNELKNSIIPSSWGLVSFQGVPLTEFSKDEIIQILMRAHTANFVLEYPDEK